MEVPTTYTGGFASGNGQTSTKVTYLRTEEKLKRENDEEIVDTKEE